MNKSSSSTCVGLIDISPEVSNELDVWPGDVAFQRTVAMEMNRGDHLTLSSITTTVHIGAHTDAPNHYAREGEAMHQRSLHYYYGDCQVIEVEVSQGKRITLDLLRDNIVAPRVLFKTNSFSNPNNFNEDFCSLSAQLIEYLFDQGVCLVGIDTPSIDPFDDKVLESHNAVAKYDMAILEGIVLTQVEPGAYTLIALPLKLKDADASPVRAALIPNTCS